LKPTETIIVGGTAVVSSAIEKQLINTKSPIILADGDLTTPVKKYLFGNARQTKEVFVLGGTAVVPDTVLDQIGGFVFGDSVY